MTCPFCGELDTRVIDSRAAAGGDAIRRRRACDSCRRRFTTFERREKQRVLVVKRNGTREEFSAEKLLNSLLLACRKRPVTLETLEAEAERIEQALLDAGVSEAPSERIGALALEGLKRIDSVAYVRFASVYLEFQEVSDFQTLIENKRRPQEFAR